MWRILCYICLSEAGDKPLSYRPSHAPSLVCRHSQFLHNGRWRKWKYAIKDQPIYCSGPSDYPTCSPPWMGWKTPITDIWTSVSVKCLTERGAVPECRERDLKIYPWLPSLMCYPKTLLQSLYNELAFSEQTANYDKTIPLVLELHPKYDTSSSAQSPRYKLQ